MGCSSCKYRRKALSYMKLEKEAKAAGASIEIDAEGGRVAKAKGAAKAENSRSRKEASPEAQAKKKKEPAMNMGKPGKKAREKLKKQEKKRHRIEGAACACAEALQAGCQEGHGEAAAHGQGCHHGHVHQPHGRHGHHAHHDEPKPGFAILTCSDTRSKKEDTAGAALEALIAERGWTCAERVVTADDREAIAGHIARLADMEKVDIVLTCGGSGLSPRDVTPEATMDVCERTVPGIAEAMRAYSLAITPRAMLSRAICAQRGSTLVINLPGSEKAARENWAGIAEALPHAVSMMAGGKHLENEPAPQP